MRLFTPPPALPDASPRRDDNLDELLRAYFRAEMPDPWPTLEAPTARTLPLSSAPRPATRRSSFRSKLALAAAVALLVTGAMLLPTLGNGPVKPEPAHNPANTSAVKPAKDDTVPPRIIWIDGDESGIKEWNSTGPK